MHTNRAFDVLQVGLLAGCLALALPGFAPAQDETDEAAASASPVAAHVYIQTLKGVMAYAATAAGQLTLIKGSPFATVGQIEGVNGKYLISMGTTNIRTYSIESGGTIGKQVAMVNTQNYGGADCGTTSFNGRSNGATLDHTGKYFYVQLYGNTERTGSADCAVWQSYAVHPNGGLTFLGDIEYSGVTGGGGGSPSSGPVLSGNDLYGYGMFPPGMAGPGYLSTFERNSRGILEENPKFSEIDPKDTTWSFAPWSVASDLSSHLAVLMMPWNDDGSQAFNVLASYTINRSTGGIVSTNTMENMPEVKDLTSVLWDPVLSMSPSGKLLAFSEYPGLQLFHFNGAAPITPYSSVLLPKIQIDQVQWDKSNHMYSLSYGAGQLHIFTATPTTISEVAGSPYVIPNAYGSLGMVVVPK